MFSLEELKQIYDLVRIRNSQINEEISIQVTDEYIGVFL